MTPPPRTPSPTISDVARLAGVSTATVSRALNQPALVAEATRRAVETAAASVGYRINAAAQTLRRGRAGAVLVLVPNLGNPFFSRIIAAIETVLAEAGLFTLIADTRQVADPQAAIQGHLRSGRVDGVISLDGNIRRVEAMTLQGAPQMIHACEWDGGEPGASVVIDNAHGAGEAIRHLAGLGHRRIGQVTGPAGNVLTTLRSRGVTEALAGLGLPERADWVFDGDFTLATGRRAAERWCALDDRPTALFCASDQMAMGLISGLVAAGVSVPGDVSVVGFDDIDVASYYTPALTTVRQPRDEIGQRAARMLLRRLGGDAEDSRVVLPATLVPRASSGPPPAP